MRKLRVLHIRVGHKTLLGLLLILVLVSSLFIFRRSAAAPCQKIADNQSVLSYTVIPTSKPLNQTANKPSGSAPQSTDGLSLAPLHPGLASSSEPQLQKLAQYEQAAGGAVASGLMLFTNIPDSTSDAKSSADDMYACLKEFAKFNLKPVVIMEPTNSKGTINFASYKNGAYDGILNAYFQTLKNLGADDKTIGMWTYFPEANLPEWGPVDVNDFAPNVVRSAQIQKNYFPASQASILLDAESYPAGSTDWGNGSYVSLSPFINGIPKGLIDSFGLQGFPWAPPANQGGDTSYNPAVFLNSSLAAAAAKQLGTANVWLNTGTFAAMYTKNNSQRITLSPAQRQSILSGVATQALNLKNSGFNVAVNLFSEDKSNTDEATDWSYKTAEAQTVFKNFALQLHANTIELWLFDS